MIRTSANPVRTLALGGHATCDTAAWSAAMDWLGLCGRIGVAAGCLLAVVIGLLLAVALAPLYLVAAIANGLRAPPPCAAADDPCGPRFSFDERPARTF